MTPQGEADVLENDLRRQGALLDILLKDRSSGRNIIWATDSYVTTGKRNDPFLPKKQMKFELVTGKYGLLIQPRAVKSKEEQKRRTKDKAEVFTPLKIVEQMNVAIDQAAGSNLSSGHTWQDYVKALKLEITCGEAPFIASRYDPTKFGKDATTPIGRRVGFLDYKLKVVSKHTETADEWLHWAEQAYKASYGYEWQGDNLLIARENLLYTLRDYYDDFCRHKLKPQSIKYLKLTTKQLEHFAKIISWNIWQMDGLKNIIPMSAHAGGMKPTATKGSQLELISVPVENNQLDLLICKECKGKGEKYHDGRPAIIKDWSRGKNGKKIRFMDLLVEK